MIVMLAFVIGFGYAMLRKQNTEINNMLKITEYMTESDVDEERFNRIMKVFEK